MLHSFGYGIGASLAGCCGIRVITSASSVPGGSVAATSCYLGSPRRYSEKTFRPVSAYYRSSSGSALQTWIRSERRMPPQETQKEPARGKTACWMVGYRFDRLRLTASLGRVESRLGISQPCSECISPITDCYSEHLVSVKRRRDSARLYHLDGRLGTPRQRQPRPSFQQRDLRAQQMGSFAARICVPRCTACSDRG